MQWGKCIRFQGLGIIFGWCSIIQPTERAAASHPSHGGGSLSPHRPVPAEPMVAKAALPTSKLPSRSFSLLKDNALQQDSSSAESWSPTAFLHFVLSCPLHIKLATFLLGWLVVISLANCPATPLLTVLSRACFLIFCNRDRQRLENLSPSKSSTSGPFLLNNSFFHFSLLRFYYQQQGEIRQGF